MQHVIDVEIVCAEAQCHECKPFAFQMDLAERSSRSQ